MKPFLLAVIFICCCSVGLSRAYALEKRRRALSEFIAFLDMTATLLKTENPPTAEIISRSDFSLFCGVTPSADAERTYTDAIEKNLARTGFSERDLTLLNSFFSEFGKTDAESQRTLVANIRKTAEKLLSSAEADRAKYAKPYVVFGLLVGATLVIIFI